METATSRSAFSLSLAIRYADADGTGLINRAQLIQYCDESLARLLRELNNSLDRLPRLDAFAVSRASAEFLSPASAASSRVDISCSVTRVRRSFVLLRIRHTCG